MERLTADDLQKIATLLEIKSGIKMMVMPNEFMKEGVAFLLMNPKDFENMKENWNLFGNIDPKNVIMAQVNKIFK